MTRHIDNNICIYRGVAWSSFPYVSRVIYYPICVTCHVSDASFYMFGNEKSPTCHVTQINTLCTCDVSHFSSCRLKMSKSLKNFTSIQTFLDTSSPRLFRLFCLLHRYSAGVHESCHMYEWVMSHTRHTHSHPLRDSSIYSASSIAILLVWISHVTHTTHTHTHAHTHPSATLPSLLPPPSLICWRGWVMLHIWMSHIAHTIQTHTHTSPSRLFRLFCHLPHYSAGMHESCHIYKLVMPHTRHTHTHIHTYTHHILSPPWLFRLFCLLHRYSAGLCECACVCVCVCLWV